MLGRNLQHQKPQKPTWEPIMTIEETQQRIADMRKILSDFEFREWLQARVDMLKGDMEYWGPTAEDVGRYKAYRRALRSLEAEVTT